MSTPDGQHDEMADRLAIRALIDAWAHCADRRQPNEQAGLFAPDGTIAVYAGDPVTSEPIQSLTGHAAMAEAFKVLSGYDVTTHFTGAKLRQTRWGPSHRRNLLPRGSPVD